MKRRKEGSLLAETRRLLNAREGSYLDIYVATGLNPSWLAALRRGMYPNASADKVQALYEHLSGKRLVKEDRHV